jgi:Ricin-type beta-trefoil lectin domain-like
MRHLSLFLIAICTLGILPLAAQIVVDKSAMLNHLTNINYFRVVVKGFTCNRETADDILERDGKRDEIYLTSFSFLVNNQNNTIPNTAIRTRTRVFCDINGRGPENKWAMAGSAAGGLGGIQTGDNIPDIEPWKNNAPPSGELLPFVLWEGNLNAGSDYVVIHPGIMEYDGPADFLTNFWHNSFIGLAARSATNVLSLPYQLVTSIPGYSSGSGYNDSSPGVWPAPTVMQQFGNVFFRANLDMLSAQDQTKLLVNAGSPADRPIGIDAKMIYNPLQIRMDNRIANMLIDRDFGYGRGIVPIRYKDDDQFKGEYTLYLAFEKVTDPSQHNRMNIVWQDVFDPLANYSFRNVNAADKETDILNGGRTNNTHVVLNDLKGLISQRWKIRKIDQYYFNINNNYNNLNLDLLNKNDINGSNIVTSAPDNSETQKWSFIRYCDGSWLVRNLRTKRMMEVYNAATHFAAPLGQWDSNAARNQRWFIEK